MINDGTAWFPITSTAVRACGKCGHLIQPGQTCRQNVRATRLPVQELPPVTIDRPRTPEMNWAKKAADKRGDTDTLRDYTEWQVPDSQKNLGSWRTINVRFPAPCVSCGTRLEQGTAALWNPHKRALLCGPDCLNTWRQARTG